MRIKNLLQTTVNPRTVALVSSAIIPVFFGLWLMAPDSVTLQQAQNWSTVCVVASLVWMILSGALVHRTFVHTYILFLGCTALFIGGRFVAHAMGFDVSILGMESSFFSVHRPDFVSIELTAQEGISLTLYIVTCLHAMHAGYMFSLWKAPVPKVQPAQIPWAISLRIPAIALAALSVIAFMVSFPDAYRAVHSNGYLSLYETSGGTLPPVVVQRPSTVCCWPLA